MNDPGWRPAVPVALRILTFRPPQGSVLMVMRGAVLFLGAAATAVAVVTVLLGAGSGEPRIDDLTAQLVLGAATAAAAVGVAVVGRMPGLPRSGAVLAAMLFSVTIRRVVVAAVVEPIGLLLSWASGDETWVIFGAGATMLLMAVAGPTRDRVEKWQGEADEAGLDLSVLEVLQRPYRA